MSQEQSEGFRQWAILELMGHRRLAGEVTEQVIAGHGFVRIDVPETSSAGPFTQCYGAQAIYCVTPTTEEIARQLAERIGERPVYAYELKPALEAVTSSAHDSEEEWDADEDRAWR